jgi:hypothetical protein
LNWARPRKTLGQISNLCRIQNHFSNIFRIFLNIYIPDRHPPGFFFKKNTLVANPFDASFFFKKTHLAAKPPSGRCVAASVLPPFRLAAGWSAY